MLSTRLFSSLRSRAGRVRPVPLTAVLCVLAAACGDGGTRPADKPEVLTLEVTSGQDQAAPVGQPLRKRVTVRVTGPDGAPRGRSLLGAEVTAGDGAVRPRQFYTNPDGLAFLEWTVGPEAGPQQVEVTSLESATPAAVTLRATALGIDQTDVVIARGATAGLTGVALFVPGDDRDQDEGGFLQTVAAPVLDTVVPLYPESGVETEVLVFSRGHPPARVRVAWTPGVDTVVVPIRPAIPVDLVIDSYVDSAGPAVLRVLQQAVIMDSIWAREGMGVRIGSVTVNQRYREDVFVELDSGELCASSVSRRGEVVVSLVHAIDGSGYAGWGCTSGNVWMAGGFERTPNLLAHELGHVFSLGHTPTGVMVASAPGTTFTEGELYRAHFNTTSGLNTVLDAWPEEARVACILSRPDSPCPPVGWELSGGG